MPGVQRRKHWGECIHCMEPYVRRPAALASNQVPLRNQVASQVLARKLSLFRAAGLSWAHDIEVKEVRPSSWPGRYAVKVSRKGLGGVSRWCRCTKCDHENSAGELMRNICPQSRAGLGDAPKPRKKVRSQAASAFHKKACREQCALGGSKGPARKVLKSLRSPLPARSACASFEDTGSRLLSRGWLGPMNVVWVRRPIRALAAFASFRGILGA